MEAVVAFREKALHTGSMMISSSNMKSDTTRLHNRYFTRNNGRLKRKNDRAVRAAQSSQGSVRICRRPPALRNWVDS